MERVILANWGPSTNIKKANFSFLEEISKGTPFRITQCSISNQIALSQCAINYTTGGYMFPDQVVFLPSHLQPGQKKIAS